jgi:hypothetical protein
MADAGKKLAERFSEYAGRKDQYDVRVIEGVDGKKQTQLIDKDTGSISFAVDGTDFDADKVNFGGSVGGDPAINPKEAVEDNKEFRTSRGNLASPTQPEAIEGAVEPTEVDKKAERENAETTETPEAPVVTTNDTTEETTEESADTSTENTRTGRNRRESK